jgi:photosystem II CP43 chlorophyll apoprotein
LYEQGFIVVPHLGTLGFSIGRGGEIRSIYSYFLSSALHLICSAFLSLGGIYHAIFGREVLEETHAQAWLWCICYQDRFRITAILGAHLGIIGSAGLEFWQYGVLMGVYDTSASGGGSCRRPFSWTEMYDVNEGLHLPVVLFYLQA